MSEIADTPQVAAPRFGLLLASTRCHFCHAPTPTAAVWVPSYEEQEEGEAPREGEAAVLRFIEWIEPGALAEVRARAPWLRMAPTRTSGTTYLAHHCTTCGALQGDHFVHSPDGPYWPHNGEALAQLRFVPCVGPLKAQAAAGESAWMERVEDGCTRG